MGQSTRRKDSIIRTFSRRLDRASGVVSFGVVVASLLTAMVSAVFVIVPGMGEEQTLKETLDQREARSDELKVEVREMEGILDALSDGYGIRRIAIERYGYKPTTEPVG
ncbi:MAG: hypothetical protein KDB07_02350 [Planctomycetes bacterium]|nr:hypothetical protein [Planctomycetota bacterium]